MASLGGTFRTPGKIQTRAIDVEMGPKPTTPTQKRRRRRIYMRTPLSVAFGAIMVFLFFVYVGTHSSSRNNASLDDQNKPAQRLDTGQPTLFTYEIIQSFPHDQGAYTQGLEFDQKCDEGGKEPCTDFFWESTGIEGRSTVREVELETGRVIRSKSLPHSDFGEGLTKFGDRLYQLTWKQSKVWSYEKDTFDDVKELRTQLRDGWGLTSNKTHIIASDGSNKIYFLDPNTLKTLGEIPVTDNGVPVAWINELEWIDGLIYANIYTKDCVVQIDPSNGAVVGWVVLEGLKDHMINSIPPDELVRGHAGPEVLNGIAWDGKKGRLFVTGKQWPKLYQVELRPMYLDSKEANVPEMTNSVRESCIINYPRLLAAAQAPPVV